MISGLSEHATRRLLLQVTLLAGPGRMLMGAAPSGVDAQVPHDRTLGIGLGLQPGEDPLAEILKAQHILLAEGRLVWGALVQANSALFARGRDDLPAAVIYSPDTAVFDDSPGLLLDIAQELYRLKGTGQRAPELAAFSRMIASEMDREMQLEVPRQLAGSATVYCTDIIVARRHLPGRVLNEQVVPLFIAPERTAMTMMLPSRFWPTST
ncbi:hypothetical protein ACF09E_11870 [Streptomyces sp. NPDC014891]|uniref:hypothetical protein n=1 Tax=Streptomyces sp. NPDC014891 TaxID=3364929 RepID=UPI0036FC570C